MYGMNENQNVDIDNKTLCTQQLDNLLIYFSVSDAEGTSDDGNYSAARGSGCDDLVMVKFIEHIAKGKKIAKVGNDEEFNDKDEAFYEEVWEVLIQSVNDINKNTRGPNEVTEMDRQDEYGGNKVNTEKVAPVETHSESEKSNREATFNNANFPKISLDNTQNIARQKGAIEESKVSHSHTYSYSDEKKSILIDPIIHGSEDYHKMKNFWKDKFASNMTPTNSLSKFPSSSDLHRSPKTPERDR